MGEARVRLRPITEADLPDYVRWLNDPEVREFAPVSVDHVTMEFEREWLARMATDDRRRIWAIDADGCHIGNCALYLDESGRGASFGITIGDKTAWGKGYGTAALREVLRIAFEEMGLHRVHLTASAENARAIRCYEKAGFRHEGLRRKVRFKGGKWHDEVLMAMLREEWEALQAAAGTQPGAAVPHERTDARAQIKGEGVLLRPLREGDLDESLRVWTPELRHMYGGSLVSERRPTIEDRRRWFERVQRGDEGHCFAIEADGRYIGHATIEVTDEQSQRARYRIGIDNPDYWGRGYGTQVTRLMLRHAFEDLSLHRVGVRVAAYNARGIRCYEKAGFRHEGVERDSFFVDGKWHDDVLMAILRADWDEGNPSPCHAAQGEGRRR